MNTTKIVELVIDEDSQELAIDCISLVSAPAIEENWVFFGKEKKNLTLAKVDEEKRMLVSPALIPNKQIFRYDPNTDSDYYVYFSKDTVRKASELYLKNNNHHKATQEHTERVSGVLTVESWIIEDTKTDKSTLYGFSLPKGTWMVKMKIENDELWSKIKSGELKGLSIEGYFTDKMQKMAETTPTDQEILSALNEIIKKKSKKVELSAINDLNSLVKQFSSKIVPAYETTRKEYSKWIEQGSQLKSRADNEYKLYNKNEAERVKVSNEIRKQAKELGVGVYDIADFKKADNTYDTYSRIYKTYDFIKKIKY